MKYLSPLRYPGGKARLAPFLGRVILAQPKKPTLYAEPFAGGAGAALKLLHDEVVEEVYLNDLNPGIASMWRAILYETNDFLALLERVRIDLDQWQHMREVYNTPVGREDLELGFATFYLNRTNRSGILNAGPIGGFAQSGKWRIDARFNKKALAKRIEKIGSFRQRITISEEDGLVFLDSLSCLGDSLFVYADPPYLVQGDGLYLHAFDESSHIELAAKLRSFKSPWLLTYDDDPRITEFLYKEGRAATFSIAHTAHKQHIGSEFVIFSDDLVLPDLEVTSGRLAHWSP